ncbi:Vi polysaccharide biosynthesis UDP-N-acetylglucosamine C-6 dehydrogenase TviB, partial [Vibrio cholerae]
MCNDKICVVGLGYVGLPLAVEFSKHVSVVGYDINSKRVEELNNNIDITRELDTEELINAGDIKFTNEIK